MIRYKVADMSCEHCVQTVSQAVLTVDPSAVVEADLGVGEVNVESVAAPERIVEAIRAAGYEADLIN